MQNYRYNERRTCEMLLVENRCTTELKKMHHIIIHKKHKQHIFTEHVITNHNKHIHPVNHTIY